MARRKRHRCAEQGCRKLATDGQYCDEHQKEAEEQQDPLAEVKKLSAMDRLRFLEADTALLNHSQEIRILQQEQQIEDAENDKRRAIRQGRIRELKAAIDTRSKEQRLMLKEFSEKYDFDPTRVSIDETTGVIMEHEPDENSSG